MWHSCVRSTATQFFRNSDPKLKRLYSEFLRFVRRLGPVRVNVTKTRISFQNRVRFAGVAAVRRDALIAGFWLKRRIHSPRFSRVDFIPPDNYVYQFRLADVSELDEDVDGWLREAYQLGERDSWPRRPLITRALR
jgi:hypothetical protein